jgi:hypothetical protein
VPEPAIVATVAGPTQEQVLDLGHDRTSADIDISLTTTEGVLPVGDLGFVPGPFRKGKAKIDPAAVVVTVVRRTQTGLELNLCIDPRDAQSGVPPGTYVGSVRVSDPRLSGQDVPVKVTVQTPYVNLLGWLGVPGAAALGLLGVWFTEQRAAKRPAFGKGTATPFGKWVRVNGVLGLILGGAAGYAIWLTQGNGDPSFGARGVDFIALLGTMVGAAYGAGGITSAAAGPRRGG